MPSFWGSDGNLVDGRFELTGRNVAEVTIAPAESIRNAVLISKAIDLSKYADIDFRVTNSANQPVYIALRVGTSTTRLLKTDGTMVQYLPQVGVGYTSHIIPSLAYNMMLSWVPVAEDVTNKIPFKDHKSVNAQILYKYDVAPTSGTLTIELVGVPN